MKDDVVEAIANITSRTGHEWTSLNEIYQEVEAIRKEPNANEGATIRRLIGDYCSASDHFKGRELFVSNGKGTGLYKLANPTVLAETKIARIIESIPNLKESSLEFKTGLPAMRKENPNKIASKTRRNKPDYIALNIIKTKNGDINEKAIFESEYRKAAEIAGENELAKMKKFFEERTDSEGYDILSYEMDANNCLREIQIEVKSTTGGEETPIDITSNELEFAKSHTDNYYIYRIFQQDGKKICKIITGQELFENYSFAPSAYKIYSK